MSAPAVYTTPKRPLVWVITGCSSGFGLELVRIAQANGHSVIATSRNPGRTPELVSEIESKGGKWVKLDVDDPESAQVLEGLEKDGNQIDVLVNNAGFGLYGAAEQFTEEEVQRQFRTNFFAPFRLSRTAVRYMRERRFGIIVNINSAAAIGPVPTMSIYGAAKAANQSEYRKPTYVSFKRGRPVLTEIKDVHATLASEVADFNVRVLSVNPGVFNTSMTSALNFQAQPLEKDYEDKPIAMLLGTEKAGSWVPDGDSKKAVKVIYEVVVGQGVGEGKENEPVLPLGREVSRILEGQIAQSKQTVKAFGDICNKVYVDSETNITNGQ